MKNADVFDKFADAEEVFEIRIQNLSGLREIKGKDEWDLVDKKQYDKKTKTWKSLKKRVNVGYDGKRKPVNIGDPIVETIQHKNLEEWDTWRSPAKRAKKQGMRASLENILFKKEAKSDNGALRLQGSQPKTIMRAFLSTSWKYFWIKNDLTNSQLAKKLNQILIRELNKSEEELKEKKKWIVEMDLKNWKRRSDSSRSLPDNEKTRKIILEIASILGTKMNEEKWQKILSKNQ